MVHIHYGKDQQKLVRLIEKIEEMGCSVFQVFLTVEGDVSCAKLIVDLKNVDVETFRNEVSRGLDLFEIGPPLVRGLMGDLFTFPIVDDGRRFILSSIEAIKGVKKSVRSRYGPVFDAMAFYAGVEVGREAYKGYYSEVRKFGFKDAVRVLGGALTALGYAKAEAIFDDGFEDRCLLVLHENLECELERPAKKPRSNFIRGLIKGSIEEATGREVDVKEIACIAKGDDTCTFSIRMLK